MQFGNMLYMNTNYRQFTVFVNKIEETVEPCTSEQSTAPSALEILQKAAKFYTHLPDRTPEKQQKGKLYNALYIFKENNIGFLPHQKDRTGHKVFFSLVFILGCCCF